MAKETIQLVTSAVEDLTSGQYKLVTATATAVTIATASTHEVVGVLEGNAALATTADQQVFATVSGVTTCIAGEVLTAFGLVMAGAAGKVFNYVAGANVNVVGRYIPEPDGGSVTATVADEQVRVLVDFMPKINDHA